MASVAGSSPLSKKRSRLKLTPLPDRAIGSTSASLFAFDIGGAGLKVSLWRSYWAAA